ncbi:MAG: yvaA [Verrucomicrobiales bacterium]|nr:yvaA [Verrucomicrobiales bacterium]
MTPKKHTPTELSLGINRRRFIYYSTIAAAAAGITGPLLAKPKIKSANEKLNIAGIGCSGKGASDIKGAFDAGVNIVALCDVDENTLNKSAQTYAGATLYRDYRKMIEKHKDLDGVIVSTPDHHHYPAAMLAVQADKHVYCQKPLTHTIWEARELGNAARKHKVATQMGNQGHCGEGVRELCEIIWSGAIGDIREVHCWTDRPIWPQGLNRPTGSDPVPANLDWDLWLGPAPMRLFKQNWTVEESKGWKRAGGSPVYHPFAWRGWWDFGCGALGDMGCHLMDPSNWALHLGAPTSVETINQDGMTSEMAPKAATIRYEFPERNTPNGKMPAVTFNWYDGGKRPEKPAEMEKKMDTNGTIFVGSKGKLVCGAYGGDPTLLPESKMEGYIRPAKTIPRVPDNDPYKDWIRAAKGGPAACSNFPDYAAPFTETVLLGNLALRLGKKLEWDSKHMKVKNMPEADRLIHKEYRKGWKV